MATDNPVFLSGWQASADLSTKQYYLVKRSGTARQVAVCTAITDMPIGVLYNKPTAAGEAAEVAGFANGTRVKVKVTAAGVAAGAVVSTHTDGTLIATTTADHFAIGFVDAAFVSADLAEISRPLPRKQGLKPWMDAPGQQISRISRPLPRKQGLKPYNPRHSRERNRSHDQPTTSTKTRIETGSSAAITMPPQESADHFHENKD